MKHEEHISPEATVSQVLADLREARSMLDSMEPSKARERLDLLLARAELGAGELHRRLAKPPRPPKPHGPPGPPVATPEDFEILLQAIKKRWPDRERLALIREMGSGGRFTSAQVRELLERFDFDDDRIEAAVLLYPKAVDQENFFQALDAFKFPFKRAEVRERLNLG